MTKAKRYMLVVLMLFLITGCSGRTEREERADAERLPDFGSLLQEESALSSSKNTIGEYPLPVRVYMDNTGSMQAFIFNENMECHADPKFVRLMRTFREMERIFYDTNYYTIQQNEQTGMIRDWLEYGGSIYQDFEKPEFYFSWKKNSEDGNVNGPLSTLYLENGRLDPKYINVVMTDLAEQNVNNSHLANEIQKMCEENGCDAYMLAFQFEYHGEAQVPDPDKINDIIAQRVDGPRPYYIIFTGPSQYLALYMERFQTCLSSLQLYENDHYYLASTKVKWDQSILDWEDIQFEEVASYDQIKEEADTGEATSLSKNIHQYEDTEGLFEEEEEHRVLAFHYSKEEGVSKAQNDWRLNFTIPLIRSESTGKIDYELQTAYYLPAPMTVEEEPASSGDEQSSTEPAETEAEKASWEWKQVKKPVFDVELAMVSDAEGEDPEAYSVKLSGRPDKELETDSILMILKISQKEEITYGLPDWLELFDTQYSDDYFQKTYNLTGFYNALFGFEYLRDQEGKRVAEHTYAEIPILITGLRGGKGK